MKRISFDLLYLLGKTRWDTGVVPPEVVEFVGSHPPGRALDIGCGTGTSMLYLFQQGWQVDGVDFSWLAVRRANSRLRKAGFPPTARVADITRLTLAQQEYNYILDIGCFHQLPPSGKQAEIRAVQRLLAPAGCWMIYGHCWSSGARSNHGLTGQEMEELSDHFKVSRRQDGQEGTRGQSVWLWLEGKGS